MKYSTLEDGYVGIALVSFAVLTLVARQLNLPLRRFIRLVAAALLPEVEWPIQIPMPLLAVFTNQKVSSGKLKILSELMVTPNGPWEPATVRHRSVYSLRTFCRDFMFTFQFFRNGCGVVRNFKEKMCLNQNWVQLHKYARFYY